MNLNAIAKISYENAIKSEQTIGAINCNVRHEWEQNNSSFLLSSLRKEQAL